MKICILGVARSGTTALYSLVQEILLGQSGESVDFIYEPFLWEKDVFNDKYNKVTKNFKYMDSISIEGIYQHLKLPLFITDPGKYEKNEYLNEVFQTNNRHSCILVKFVRANGRILLLERICPGCKFIFIIRNPIDVINSAIVRFSLYGSEFHKDDFKRFVKEVNSVYGEMIEEGGIKFQVEKEVLYWYYMNRFAFETLKELKKKTLIICYEDYVSHRKLWVDRICDFLGIQRKEKYYEFSEAQGGSSTKTVNLDKFELQLLAGYMDKYKELLKSQGIGNNINFNEIMAKYKNLPEKTAGEELIIPRETPNYMKIRMLSMERIIREKDEEIRILKQRLKLLEDMLSKP